MKFTVRQARVYRGITMEEMASKMNICCATYRKIERKPESATVKQALAISQITGIPVDDIFFSK